MHFAVIVLRTSLKRLFSNSIKLEWEKNRIFIVSKILCGFQNEKSLPNFNGHKIGFTLNACFLPCLNSDQNIYLHRI